MNRSRAISDALGFVLVFGIIISTVAVIYVGGFNALDNARQYERMNNAERAFEVFSDNVEDLTQRNAPSRATEIKLEDATIKPGSKHTIKVNVTRADAHGKNKEQKATFEPIVYQSDTDQTNKMTYSLGATFRSSTGGTTISTEPSWILNESRVIVPIIDTNSDDAAAITGSETVLVRTVVSRQEVIVQNTTEKSDVWINITSSRDDPWRRYLRDNDAVECKSAWQSSDTVSCRVTEVDIVYVSYVRISYLFE